MHKSFLRLGAYSLAWTLVLGLGVYSLITLAPKPERIRPHGYTDEVAGTQTGTIGGERMAELQRATRLYVQQHPEAPAAMKQGKALAPVDFLNEQLASHREKFRVQKAEGLEVEMYDVS